MIGHRKLLWSRASWLPTRLHHIGEAKKKKKCLRRAGTWLSLPQCRCITSASPRARIAPLLSGVTKGCIHTHTALNSIICRIENCQMLPYCFCFVLKFIKNKNPALHFTHRGLGAGSENEKPSVHFKFFFLLTSSDALLWYCLDHCTKINCMHTGRTRAGRWFSCDMPKKKKEKKALNLNLWSRLLHH